MDPAGSVHAGLLGELARGGLVEPLGAYGTVRVAGVLHEAAGQGPHAFLGRRATPDEQNVQRAVADGQRDDVDRHRHRVVRPRVVRRQELLVAHEVLLNERKSLTENNVRHESADVESFSD